jgi:poly-gamma-glutamate capsule biosynthesis protein CapA/YwtB (metallophosphatase superfamily)
VDGSKTVVVAAVGDFMIDRRANPLDIERVRTLLGGADIAIANVDTVLSDQGQPSPKYANLRGPRESVHDLRAMGLDVVTLANNHAMDFRAEGMLDMRTAYREAGIQSIGAGATIVEATAPAIVTIDGRRVAILSVACTFPQDAAAGPTWPGIAPVKIHESYGIDPTLAAEQPCS